MSAITNKHDDKLCVAQREIHEQLANISQNLASSRSAFLIPNIEILHAAPVSHIYSLNPASKAVETEEVGYRCKCSFQLVPASSAEDVYQVGQMNPSLSKSDLLYAIRIHGEIVPLVNGVFPPANERIQSAMKTLLSYLNARDSMETNEYKYISMRNNLTSVTFVSSWGDGIEDNIDLPGDCHVTLHYGPPGLFQSLGAAVSNPNISESCNKVIWKRDAQGICNSCSLSSLTTRSKGIKITAFHPTLHDSTECAIHDDLWITIKQNDGISEIVGVSLVSPDNIGGSSQRNVKVQYTKSTEAFQHPNAGVMLTSLHWLLGSLSWISQEYAVSSCGALSDIQKPRLLEMYCGCGAHTIPIAKSNILSEIVAIELDDRLVTACKNNCLQNNCLKGSNGQSSSGTPVSIFKGDTAMWALSSRNKPTMNNTQHFDILLVDPPRDGLDKTVCDFALNGHFQDIIYISCGRRALLRDLNTLCMGGFDVRNLAVIDLFPGTDAVESLIHLRRAI